MNKFAYVLLVSIILLGCERDGEVVSSLNDKDIKIYGRKDLNEGKLVNKTNGGEGVVGRVLSDNEKERLQNLRKGSKTSDEHKEKLRIAQQGRKYSDESKKKMSDSAKGKQKTKEHKENLSKSGKGVKRTEESKEKLRNLYKGKQRNKDMIWKK
jgi:hypothetical protein